MNWTTNDLNKHLKRQKKSASLFPDMEIKGSHESDYDELVKLVSENKAIYIPGSVPSLKNGKQIFQMNTGKSICCNAPYIKIAVKQYKCTKCNVIANKLGTRATLVPSDRHKKYKEDTTGYYIKNRQTFLQLTMNLAYPHYLAMYFIRDSKRSFDLDNAASTILDLLRDNNWIVDDSADMIIPVFLGYHVDKNSAGVIITVTNQKPIFDYNSIQNNSNNINNKIFNEI